MRLPELAVALPADGLELLDARECSHGGSLTHSITEQPSTAPGAQLNSSLLSLQELWFLRGCQENLSPYQYPDVLVQLDCADM